MNVSAEFTGGFSATETVSHSQGKTRSLRRTLSRRFFILTLIGVIAIAIGALAQASAAVAADFDQSLVEATDRVVRVAEGLMAGGMGTREAMTRAVRTASEPGASLYLFGPRSEPLHAGGTNRWVLRWSALEAQLQGSYQNSYIPAEGDPVRLYARRVDIPGDGEYVVMAAAEGTAVREQQSVLARRYLAVLLLTLAPVALYSTVLNGRARKKAY